MSLQTHHGMKKHLFFYQHFYLVTKTDESLIIRMDRLFFGGLLKVLLEGRLIIDIIMFLFNFIFMFSCYFIF